MIRKAGIVIHGPSPPPRPFRTHKIRGSTSLQVSQIVSICSGCLLRRSSGLRRVLCSKVGFGNEVQMEEDSLFVDEPFFAIEVNSMISVVKQDHCEVVLSGECVGNQKFHLVSAVLHVLSGWTRPPQRVGEVHFVVIPACTTCLPGAVERLQPKSVHNVCRQEDDIRSLWQSDHFCAVCVFIIARPRSVSRQLIDDHSSDVQKWYCCSWEVMS